MNEGSESEKYYSKEDKEKLDVLEKLYLGPGMREQKEIALFPNLLQNVSLFVDIGASLGPYAYVANKHLKNGRIVCLEPDQLRFLRLSELSTKWQKASTNEIEVVHAAASDKKGKIDFYMADGYISGGLFKHHVPDSDTASSQKWTKQAVDAVTLDDFFADCDPDLVKIDVEGAEYRVLLGAKEILKRGKCRFLIEIHPWGDEALKKTPADIFNLLNDFGYDFSLVHRHWYFVKSDFRMKRFIKNRVICFIMNHGRLKDNLKRFVLMLQGSSFKK